MKAITKRLEKMNYTKSFERSFVENGVDCRIVASVRFNDECKNGHNTFSITGETYREEQIDSCGCIHDEIEKHFTELKKFIRWHLVNTDGPWGYIDNTMYYSSEQKAGVPDSWEERIQFGGFPMTFKLDSKFLKFLERRKGNFDLKITPRKHINREGVEPNYTFNSFGKTWYDCPFDDINEAEEFLAALKKHGFKTVKVVSGWTEEKKADLEGARSSAIWPEATKKQLQSKSALLKRLPQLMLDFEKDLIELKDLEIN